MYTPSYYSKFHCIAGDCKDSCCIGWEIDIDESSIARYLSYTGPLAEELLQSMVSSEEETYFKLRQDGRCPFLNEDNLCRIYREMGEDALCQICTDHPRFYDCFEDGYTEAGIGMACEEAARLILSEEAEYPTGAECHEADLKPLFETRTALISQGVEWQEDFFTEENVREFCADLLDMEINTDEWRELLLTVSREFAPGDMPELSAEEQKRYDHIYAYLIYRHFMKCRFDGDVESVVAFADNGIHLIRLLSGFTSLERAAILFSRELEYVV